MKVTIDHRTIEVAPGTTLLQAARSMGIEIPTLCWMEGHNNHPSCFICVVEEEISGRLIPSCAMKVEEGISVLSVSPAVMKSRRDALELLLSDHTGDCVAPCQLSCPAGMDIPLMNRLLTEGRTREALSVVRREIALPLVLGYICPAPCEKACRRKYIDSPVQICLLKRFTARDPATLTQDISPCRPGSGKSIAVIGTGPAGLAAAFHALRLGHNTVLYDKAASPGGALRYAIPDNLLPKDMLDADIEVIRRSGGIFEMNSNVDREHFERQILPSYDAVILATGFPEEHPVGAFSLAPVEKGSLVNRKQMTTSLPGIFGCGSIVTEQLLSVRSVDQGKRAAYAAHRYLTGEDPAPERFTFRSVISGMKPEEKAEYLKEGSPEGAVDLSQDYLDGLTPAEAVRESSRCLHCDCRKPAACKLRACADIYGADRKRYSFTDRKQMTRSVHHDLVTFEQGKCIRCGLCISVAAQMKEPLGLTFINRGFDVTVAVPFNEELSAGLSVAAARCAEACPTGALALKNPPAEIA